MGKGDKRTKKGKITIGSTGVSRPAKKAKPVIAEKPKKKATVKKTAAKKTTKKETEKA